MDRTRLSEASIHDMAAAFADELCALTIDPLEDLETIERRLQEMGRRVFGPVASALVRMQGEALARPDACALCGQAVRLVGARRRRQARGLVGDLTLERAAYVCTACGHGMIPLDAALGLGPWGLTPALARVVARAGITDSFAAAAESLHETLGIEIPVETVRVLTEAVGAVAEAEQQDAIAALRDGRLEESVGVDTLLVEVDGVQVWERAGWHEMKIGRAAPLGPLTHTDPRTGRATLLLGPSLCGGGLEAAEESWWRMGVLARQAGLGPATRRVVVLCDGAAWIWNRAAAFLGGPGREVVEIVDIFHAYEHLWDIGHALYPDAATCAAWVEPLKDALYVVGAPAVIAALDAAQPSTLEAADLLRTTRAYFAEHAARMAYPQFVAQHWPIGSGAIESLCKNLVAQRAKGAGMRWTAAGVQAIVSLRAVHRSGQWADFWARQPLRASQRRWPRKQRTRTPRPALPPAPTVAPPPTPPPLLRLPSAAWRNGPAILPRRSA
jgi:hypothetical protein